MKPAPESRRSARNERPVRPERDFVLYWMIANRRAGWNFSLQHAAAHARDLGKPLVVLEGLRVDYRWASDRVHRFVLDGMEDNARRFSRRPVLYYPYVEPSRGAGKGLLEALAERACVVVTDDFPTFFLPRMVAAASERLDVRLEAVDSNGLYPMRATDQVFARAYSFRRHLQKELSPHLEEFPDEDPLKGLRIPRLERLPREIESRWPAGTVDVGKLPLDHRVSPAGLKGGAEEGERVLRGFLEARLPRYAEERNEPEKDVSSGLSPYLHFGHISVHQVLASLAVREHWTPREVSTKASGSRSGWWGMSAAAESFLDELITWRELGYNFAALRDDHDRFESLPDWCHKTLNEHRGDSREHVYDLDAFERARTHDGLWNAAQNQLVREGRIHNYLRMLWGKKILEWSSSPEEAADVMIELNNKYALDGRNPNSYSGIFWVLGRYDRPWGPERPIFGKIRYMSSENTARKVRVKDYLRRYAREGGSRLL
jgi:deoxyribodipyrimidine photo-lyase